MSSFTRMLGILDLFDVDRPFWTSEQIMEARPRRAMRGVDRERKAVWVRATLDALWPRSDPWDAKVLRKCMSLSP